MPLTASRATRSPSRVALRVARRGVARDKNWFFHCLEKKPRRLRPVRLPRFSTPPKQQPKNRHRHHVYYQQDHQRRAGRPIDACLAEPPSPRFSVLCFSLGGFGRDRELSAVQTPGKNSPVIPGPLFLGPPRSSLIRRLRNLKASVVQSVTEISNRGSPPRQRFLLGVKAYRLYAWKGHRSVFLDLAWPKVLEQSQKKKARRVSPRRVPL